MKTSEWKNFAIGLIDGLERQLSSSAPKTARLKLAELRDCISNVVTATKRKSWERKVDSLTESSSFFKAAAQRHIGLRMDSALDGLEQSIEGMIKLAKVQGKKDGARKVSKLLEDFRKKRRKIIYKPINNAKK